MYYRLVVYFSSTKSAGLFRWLINGLKIEAVDPITGKICCGYNLNSFTHLIQVFLKFCRSQRLFLRVYVKTKMNQEIGVVGGVVIAVSLPMIIQKMVQLYNQEKIKYF